MNFSNTIGAFINECVNYPYSAESFENDKLSYEIALAEKYHDSMIVAANTPVDTVLCEGFFATEIGTTFMEDASPEVSQMQSVTDEIKNKTDKLSTRIIETASNFLKKFARFCIRIASKFTDRDDNKKFIDLLNNTKINADDMNTIITKAEELKKDWPKDLFDIDTGNRGMMYAKRKIKDASTTITSTLVKPLFDVNENNKTMVTLATAYIKLAIDSSVIIIPKNKNKPMISFENIRSVFGAIEDGKSDKSIASDVNNTINESFENGIEFVLNADDKYSFTSMAARFDRLSEALKQEKKNISHYKYNDAISKVINAAGNTMSAITHIATYRNKMYTVIHDIINSYTVLNKKTK